MSTEQARVYITQAQDLLTKALAELPVTPPGPPPIVLNPTDDLQKAHDAAPDGSTIYLNPGTYPNGLLASKALTWTAVADPGPGRVSSAFQSVIWRAGGPRTVVHTSPGSTFRGITFQNADPNATIIEDTG